MCECVSLNLEHIEVVACSAKDQGWGWGCKFLRFSLRQHDQFLRHLRRAVASPPLPSGNIWKICHNHVRLLAMMICIYSSRRNEKTTQRRKSGAEKIRKKFWILKIYSRWISNLKPCSIPDSGIKVCSARHETYFPWSSSIGVYVRVDLVKFPSTDVCAGEMRRKNINIKIFPVLCVRLPFAKYGINAHPFTSRSQLTRSFPPVILAAKNFWRRWQRSYW